MCGAVRACARGCRFVPGGASGQLVWTTKWKCLTPANPSTRYVPPAVTKHVPTVGISPQARAHAAAWVLVDAAKNSSELPTPFFYLFGGLVMQDPNTTGDEFEPRNDMCVRPA